MYLKKSHIVLLSFNRNKSRTNYTDNLWSGELIFKVNVLVQTHIYENHFKIYLYDVSVVLFMY